MEIKDERNRAVSNFGPLIPGDVFEYDAQIFMRIERIDYGDNIDEFYNAISVRSGRLFAFIPEELVTPLVVQLRILHNE